METLLPIQKAANILGGVVALADSLGLNNYQTAQQWAKTQVPAEYCPDIERATNGQVTCEELRPDLAAQWAYLRGTKKAA